MLFLIDNRILIKDREKTYLTAAVDAADTTLTVRSVDSNAWSDNDWIIVGEIGTSNAELLQINGAVSDGTSLTIDNAGSGGARYAHSIDEPVYRIDYNQIVFARATTESGTKSTLTTAEIQPDDIETRYEDTANTTGYGFAQFYNSQTALSGPWSDAIPYTGQSTKALSVMVRKVRTLLHEPNDDAVTDDEIVAALNDAQRDVLHASAWKFNEIERSTSAVANQFAYDIDTDFKELYSVRFDSQPLAAIPQHKWELIHWDTDQTSDSPSHVAIREDQIRLYPRPSESAATTTLDGDITSSDTTITVADTSSWNRGDYYRFKINDEIIYATSRTTTTFTGCLRGQEGTTAANHSDLDTVTEHDIVMTGQREAVDLSLANDETVVPEPALITTMAAAELAHASLNDHNRGDRYDLKAQRMMENLRARYARKLKSQRYAVRDYRSVVNEGHIAGNVNDYPSSVDV